MIISQQNGRMAIASLILLLFGGRGESRTIIQQRQGSSTVGQLPSAATAAPNPGATASPEYFETSWPTLQKSYELNIGFEVAYKVVNSNDIIAQQGILTLVLLWTTATSGFPDSSNTHSITTIRYLCATTTGGPACDSYKEGSGGTAHVQLLQSPNATLPSHPDGLLGSFFFCFATGIDASIQFLTCESFSNFFELSNLPPAPENGQLKQKRAIPNIQVPTATLPVTLNRAFIYPSGSPPPSAALASPSPASVTPTSQVQLTSLSTISKTPTGTTIVTVAPSSTSTESSIASASKSSKGGLGTGAIVGIAIGGFALIVIAFLVIFFCYRRRQRKRNSQPEQVLLAHNMHSGSRDLMAEKDGPDRPVLGSMLETLPSSGPYDHLSSSAPYSGNAGPGGLAAAGGLAATAPRRTPTSATQTTYNTNTSRGMSDASGPTGRGDFEEPYHDEPIATYGDARHVPQVYRGTSPAPFLSEPGMTDEELARLEEEERRIDAAIAEAEGRR